jgi:alpha-L-arabinofuranosidase
MDKFIDEVVALADAVAAKRRSTKRMMLSFDEWNVWYRTRRNLAGRVKEGWPVAPPILEEIYTMEDALAFGGACISLLNHADRVKIACLAQLVNAIAPIMTETGGAAWRQTIFFPFAHMSRLGRGKVLRARVESDSYDSSYFDPRGAHDFTFPVPNVSYLKLAAVAEETGGLSLFMLNRDLTQEVDVSLEVRSFGRLAVSEALELRDDDLQATNNGEATERVKPKPLQGVTIEGTRMRAALKPASWNVIHLSAT